MKSFKDPKWQAFVKKCKKRVTDDNKELGIESVFLPQSEICPKPKYLTIAMEPGMDSVEEMKKWIKMGYKGFVNFTIDYCAYKFLCGEKYQYQFVDFCKGAMTQEDAGNSKTQRYKNWLPLLKEEWELLGKPPIIAVGKGMYDILTREIKKYKFEMKIADYIIHYSRQTAGYRKKIYERFQLKSYLPKEENKIEMKKVIDELLKKNELKQSAISEIWNGKLYKDIEQEQLFALYKSNFKDFKTKGKIQHFLRRS